ncbi:probable inactive receptor-like protein kinase At3g56050 [Cucurbita moschata]|uniref:Probable inactive receptor-like protein kinase At3g56050 n=1 Tax=Cucurbita moschata TaxID=3662 RepID=A0A6J1FUK5_CUCMO|nr:probable inactive receptor-like protein kinase At3g56050 [Cucurbita moschata]XP_022944003.1 probable inactive receptor-like protein kinase At3g56050 [Cucurbita moschata]XP_022944004.1 probable inactive receptor-like protein kinase At3g56050 [Cucurbita moschata]
MGMDERWRFRRQRLRWAVLAAAMLIFQSMRHCFSLNDEGVALLRIREGILRDPFGGLWNWKDNDEEFDHCSWFGVECSEGKVVILNLKDLCLVGKLAPEMGRLSHIKSIILRNNSFYGGIPQEIGQLLELEVLDLGFNNLSGLFPLDLGKNLSLTTLLLDHNEFITQTPENHVNMDRRSLLSPAPSESMRHSFVSLPPSSFASSSPLLPSDPPLTPEVSPTKPLAPWWSAPAPSLHLSPAPASAPSLHSPVHVLTPPHSHRAPPRSLAPSPSLIGGSNKKKDHRIPILAGIISGSLFFIVISVGILIFRSSKVVTVKPWATGLSGQLQKAFVTGVPKLRRSELEAACEDFSNIIGSFSDITVYKGTLSSGVEIAVTSTAVTSNADWSKTKEEQFRKKVETLSRVNHKNFVSLVGFCEEAQPFTRMMVFEYAPNGTLFEHLHIKEAEHLDWETRLRIAMGVAYCLEHMHQLDPPVIHRHLCSSSVYLTEDYAAKLSDFSYWSEETAAKLGSATVELLETSPADSESNVYSFGVILLEMITGRIPFSVDDGSLADWAVDFVKGEQSLREMVDPILSSFKEEQLESLSRVIKRCIQPEPKQGRRMSEIAARLKEITALEPAGATPKVSPLWWAELEIISTES